MPDTWLSAPQQPENGFTLLSGQVHAECELTLPAALVWPEIGVAGVRPS